MIWSGDKVPITANKDDAAVFFIVVYSYAQMGIIYSYRV